MSKTQDNKDTKEKLVVDVKGRTDDTGKRVVDVRMKRLQELQAQRDKIEEDEAKSEESLEETIESMVGKKEEEEVTPQDLVPIGAMNEGDVRFGVTAVDTYIGDEHWLVDSSVYGDLIAALPKKVLVAGRTEAAGSVAVDLLSFLDAVYEGAGQFEDVAGIAEASGKPRWVVLRLMGSFPVLNAVYDHALDVAVRAVELAAIKAAMGIKSIQTRERTRKKVDANGNIIEEETTSETIDKVLPPDPALSRLVLTNRMKHRYKDDGGVQQAVQINIVGPEANL